MGVCFDKLSMKISVVLLLECPNRV
jgi:hypothetical protein